MREIFKFKTEEQLDKFDEKYEYSGTLGENSWVYGEGEPSKWFSIQYCGDRWVFNYRFGNDDGPVCKNIKVYTLEELENEIHNNLEHYIPERRNRNIEEILN